MRARWVWILTIALACGGEERQPAAGSEPAVVGETVPQPAGPGPWVEEIRSGIRGLPTQVARDPVAARRRAVDLYVTRQEALERRWGVRGSDAPDSTLARTVMDAEAGFHDLLALLNREAAPDSAEVAAGVAALDARLEAVLTAAGEAR
jgi:hypothetical protein